MCAVTDHNIRTRVNRIVCDLLDKLGRLRGIPVLVHALMGMQAENGEVRAFGSVRNRTDDIQHAADHFRVERRGRLIEQHDLWLPLFSKRSYS